MDSAYNTVDGFIQDAPLPLTSTTSGNETLQYNPYLCILQTCDLSLAAFTYIPNLAGNALFLGLFILLFIAQAVLGIWHRTWGFMGAMLLGLTLEIFGYTARLLLHSNPFSRPAFLTYLTCCTLAPALLAAAIYLCLSRIVTAYGAQYSRFAPRTYMFFFSGCDVLSLMLQGLGGGIAVSADDLARKDVGKNVMLAGLVWQVVSMAVFAACCAEFAHRVRGIGEGGWRFGDLVASTRWRRFLGALALATLAIFIRSVYRVAELSGGFDGRLFNDQVTFMLLEGPMIIIACTALSLFHPAVGFQGYWHEATFVLWEKFTFTAHNKSSQIAQTGPGWRSGEELMSKV